MKSSPPQSIIYVARDLERALGYAPTTEGYTIISNSTPFAKEIAGTSPSVHLIESPTVLDTADLLEHPKVHACIEQYRHGTIPHILVFKNTERIERICTEKGWHLLNPSATLANTIEEKISQITWLGELSNLLPPHTVQPCKDITWDGSPFILQFNRAHTGTGTLLISSQQDLERIQVSFPDRPARKT
ncbi:MAG TPA: hypothetical protein VEA18_02405, partial [Candidatus Kapabacteria bacterium]|nr:hypothetical protein [Candidatus Kapabacteria bacterium]